MLTGQASLFAHEFNQVCLVLDNQKAKLAKKCSIPNNNAKLYIFRQC